MIKILFFFSLSLNTMAKICEYRFTVWNTNSKTSDGPYKIQKDYKNLNTNEIGPLGCTPCEIDQKEILLTNKLKVKVCIKIADVIEKTLTQILKSGYTIETIVGYRPSLSKGLTDTEGKRTELSNHAFGVAIDINENFNGLYNNCDSWSEKCKLLKGGIYNLKHPLSLTLNSHPVSLFKKSGLKWGGEILGKQKDFMHFSPTGY